MKKIFGITFLMLSFLVTFLFSMKKCLFVFLTFILCLGFANKVEAISCLYEGVDDDGNMFKVRVLDTLIADNEVGIYPLNDFNVEGETKGPTDSWDTDAGWLDFSRDNLFIIDDSSNPDNNGRQITSDDKCYPYLFYDVTGGLNKWYFSDGELNGKSADVKLEIIESDVSTEDNFILDELICTYQRPTKNHSGDPASSLTPRYITYIISPSTQGGNDSFNYKIIDENGTVLVNTTTSFSNVWAGGSTISSNVVDALSPRIFWYEDTKSYECPQMIAVGYNDEGFFPGDSYYVDYEIIIGYYTDELDDELSGDVLQVIKEIMSQVESAEEQYDYSLVKNGSSIKGEAVHEEQGQLCTYGRPEEMAQSKSNYYFTLSEIIPVSGSQYYTIIANENQGLIKDIVDTGTVPWSNPNFTIASGKLMKSCDDLPEIYTDCLLKDGNNCTISETEFEGSELLVQNYALNQTDATTIKVAMGSSTGYKYKTLVCELGNRLKLLTESNQVSLNNSSLADLIFFDYSGSNKETYNIYQISSNDNICSSKWKVTDYKCADEYCKEYIEYSTEKKVREIVSYCNEKYDSFTTTKLENSSYIGRMEECIQFHSFYESLVSNGIIDDLSAECDFLSDDFVYILQRILNIIKIAGPLIALGLGTLDFVRTVASGDADKEMKNTFKRFSTRLIAAALLFLVPLTLAFLMDMFLGNQDGYNTNNPFCSIVDWGNQ